MKEEEKIILEYTGESQEFVVPFKGIYKLECWGAQGGSYSSQKGGLGGYSTGTITLKKDTILYCNVGGTTTAIEGGFNGGGSGIKSGKGGGGATDIRLIGGNWDDNSGLLSRIIVAGGGGGAGVGYGGGYGGGEVGGDGYTSLNRSGTGGTQTTGGTTWSNVTEHYGSFGKGGSISKGYSAGGGGSGWYGGGGAYDNDSDSDGRGGGGGSAYVLTESSYKPEGYIPSSDFYFNDTLLVSGNSEMPSPTSEENQIGNIGNGYIRITLLKKLTPPMKCNVKGKLKDVDMALVKINGKWKEVEEIIQKRNGSWNI